MPLDDYTNINSGSSQVLYNLNGQDITESQLLSDISQGVNYFGEKYGYNCIEMQYINNCDGSETLSIADIQSVINTYGTTSTSTTTQTGNNRDGEQDSVVTTTTYTLDGLSLSSKEIKKLVKEYADSSYSEATSKLKKLRDIMLARLEMVEIPDSLPGVNRESERYKTETTVFDSVGYNAAVAAWEAGGKKGDKPTTEDYTTTVVTYDEDLIAADSATIAEMNELIAQLKDIYDTTEDFLNTVADSTNMDDLTEAFNSFFGGYEYDEEGNWVEVEGALDIAAELKEKIATYNGDYEAGSGIAEAQAMLHSSLESFGDLVYDGSEWEEYDEEFYLLCLYVTIKAIVVGISIADIRQQIWHGEKSPLEKLFDGEDI